MRKVLLIGAGRSSSWLIKYFLDNAETEKWILTIADVSIEQALAKTANHPASLAVKFDISNEADRIGLISDADIVISLLPATMHLPVAMECVKQKKNLITASYVSSEMAALDTNAKSAGIVVLNECGLDPGIDHMSAMKIIDEVKSEGGKFSAFRSYTGGLVAPESNDNPWGYKFSWNPRNVILAGQGTAKLIENNCYKYIPYSRLFSNPEVIEVEGLGKFDGYANRDSLAYRKVYGLDDIPTMLRGTLRQFGYCKAWNVFVQLGLTDDTFAIEDSEHLTYRELIEAFLPASANKSVDARVAELARVEENGNEMELIKWTGFLSETKIGLKHATPAQILQHLLEEKWKLQSNDKDMIVMQHIFEYELKGKSVRHFSSLVVKGDDQTYTAMAKTVGLPAAIACKLILNKKITAKGVVVPVDPMIYNPILKELESYGIRFEEKVE